MSLKGYVDKKKSAEGAPDFATYGPVREGQIGLDVIGHVFAQLVGSDAAEADSTTRVINATSHAALVGDVINWTSGNLRRKEFRVSAVSTNSITTAEAMSEAPAAADTFKILRPKVPVLNEDGEQTIAASLNQDENWGAVGDSTLLVAAVLGNEDGQADFNSGAAGDQTLRTVLATRHEAAATPVSIRKGNGTGFDSYGSGATGTTVPRVITASRAKVEVDTHDHATPVTTLAWTELIASTSAEINRLYIADTSGSFLILGVGAAASEVAQIYLSPGFAGWIDLNIPASSRVSIKALDSDTASGRLIFTGFS